MIARHAMELFLGDKGLSSKAHSRHPPTEGGFMGALETLEGGKDVEADCTEKNANGGPCQDVAQEVHS